MMLVVLVKQWIRYMLKALITGGSTGFGSVLVDKLSKTYDVDVMPRELLLQTKVSTPPGGEPYDLILFNHHYMPEDFDILSYENNCLICLRILESYNLSDNCKVGWMLSKGIGAKFMPEYAPYFAFKAVNLHIMRYLAHKRSETYFGIEPGHIKETNWHYTAEHVVKILDEVSSGHVFNLNGDFSSL